MLINRIQRRYVAQYLIQCRFDAKHILTMVVVVVFYHDAYSVLLFCLLMNTLQMTNHGRGYASEMINFGTVG